MSIIEPLPLLKQLVAIRSFVSSGNDETALADFLADFLRQNVPELTVEKQYIDNSRRYNVLVRGKKPPKLFVLGHIDTVQPKQSWSTDPVVPVVKSGYLYGLGAADMKGSLAAWLAALAAQKDAIRLDELAMLWYVDEEYDFAGIKRFVKDLPQTLMRPELILSLDGELNLSSGCRGLIEINMTLCGKGGHAANPASGVNAITETVALLQDVENQLRKHTDVYLGASTLNIAYLRGGTIQQKAGQDVWEREGNVIPDIADVTFEVRPANKKVTAAFVLNEVKRLARSGGLHTQIVSVRHDIASWPVSYDSPQVEVLKKAYRQAGVPFAKADRAFSGYIDAQMVADKMPAPAFIIGAGGQNKHSADECVPLANLTQARKLYEAILMQYLGGRDG